MDHTFKQMTTLAAMEIGIPAKAAESFGRTGVLQVGGTTVSIQPLHGDEPSPWALTAYRRRPAAITEDTWVRRLLLANSYIMLGTRAAFAMNQHGEAALAVGIESHHHNVQQLALSLYGALALANSVDDEAGTSATPHASTADRTPPSISGNPAPALQPDLPDTAAMPLPMAHQLRSALHELGVEAGAIDSVFEDGELTLSGLTLGVAPAPGDEEILIVAAPLGHQCLGTTAQACLALRANMPLLLWGGICVAARSDSPRMAQLMLRVPTPPTHGGPAGVELARRIAGFAAMADGIGKQLAATAAQQASS